MLSPYAVTTPLLFSAVSQAPLKSELASESCFALQLLRLCWLSLEKQPKLRPSLYGFKAVIYIDLLRVIPRLRFQLETTKKKALLR